MNRAALVAASVALVIGASACTPLELDLFRSLTPADQETLGAELRQQTADCHHAVDALWPADSAPWAHRIVDRESRGVRTADNPTSSASGCFQLLAMHAWRYSVAGYSWGDRYDARANTLAALGLYLEQGARPWT